MAIDVTVPSVGESVQEALLSEWFKKDGDRVEKDEVLFVIETDKVTLEVVAETDGILHILAAQGETVAVGAVVARIEPTDNKQAAEETSQKDKKQAEKAPAPEKEKEEVRPGAAEESAQPEPEPEPEQEPKSEPEPKPASGAAAAKKDLPVLSPSLRRQVAEKGIDVSQIKAGGPDGRVSQGDVLLHLQQAQTGIREAKEPPAESKKDTEPSEVRKAMTPIRKRIAARLLEARRNTAMLTTFNDIDMSRAMAIRSQYKEEFKARYDVSLGFMSFFIKACVTALQEFPEINAFVEGEEIVYHNYQHIGVAIGSGRGLVVPVIRHAEQKSFAAIEKAIIDYVEKINKNRLELDDLEGGTFTISNGGVYGSLLSTPILNTPQSGILGMHRIEKRPVAIDDQIVIRPMMYVALSYDHRIVDGREAVTFLKRIKELIENPERLILEV